ncbi:MAG TPA: T9SS type A sorting domain-containing protein, partial [Bacteroidetes bacterium]|nr:T9SS type A sorting domain-containing protein [Bacteroidota bacterium]
GTAPQGRIESARTGWPVQAYTRKGEIIISHDPSIYSLRQMNRLYGTTSWTDSSFSNTVGIWPRIASSNDTVYLIYAKGTGGTLDSYLTSFAKSQDGGETWDTVNMILPNINSANGYTRMGGDAYVIAAKDDIVAIVSGNSNNSLRLWKSLDAGVTWNISTIMHAGIEANDTVALSSVTPNAVVSDTIATGVDSSVVTQTTTYDSTTIYGMDSMLIVNDTSTQTLDTISIDSSLTANQVINDTLLTVDSTSSTLTIDTLVTLDTVNINNVTGGIAIDTIVTSTNSAVVSFYEIWNFDGTGAFGTDVDGDLIADTINTSDGGHEILIDNNGKVHVFTGYMRIFDNDAADGWSFFPGMDGVMYWNEDYDADSLKVIGYLRDMDGDNTLDGLATGNIPNYGMALSSMAGAAIDTSTGNIYCVYASAVENSDYYEDPSNPSAQSFRDLFGVYSEDGGLTWTDPVNLTSSARDYYENVFPSVADIADGKVHVIWQRDQEPGTSLEATPDPISENQIVYQAFEYEDFYNAAPNALFEDSINIDVRAKVHFTDLSTGDISSWAWDFGDGFTSDVQNPKHTYLANNTYNVCLTVTNPWGNDQECKNITLDQVGIEEMGMNIGSILPNPANGNIHINLNGNDVNDLNIGIYNILGEMITEEYVNQLNGNMTYSFDISTQAEGVYFVRLQSDKGLISRRIILTE